MRKLMAWVLTIVMMCLPLTTLAESSAIDLRFTFVDVAAYLDVFQEELFGEEDEAFLSLVRKGGELAADVLKASTLRLQWQEDGCRLSLLLDEKEAVSAAIMETKEGLVFSSSLLPGYGLTMPATTVDVGLDRIDWEDLAEDLVEECFDWSTSIAGQEVVGSFSGTTYAGGTKATYVTITDQDVALLLDSLLLCLEDDDDLMAWLENCQGESGSQLLYQARRSILDAGVSSTYSYQLTMVEDDTGAVIGLDWETYQENVLAWTLSVGNNASGVLALLTIPLNDSNCYLAVQADAEGMTFTAYQCENDVPYQEAAQTDQWKTFSARWTANVTEQDDDYTGSASQHVEAAFEDGIASMLSDTSLSGNIAKDFSAGEITLTEKINGTKVISMAASLQSADPFEQAEGLTLVDVTAATDEEWSKVADALEQGEEDALIALFKLLPAKLLRKLVEFQQELTNLTTPAN